MPPRPGTAAISDAYTDLITALRTIAATGWLPATTTGDGAAGEAVEAALGITRNNSTAADWNGIELKAATGRDTVKIRDLFTLSPTPSPHPTQSRRWLVDNAGYLDTRGRQALKVTVTATTPNPQHLQLAVDGDWVLETWRGTTVAAWSLPALRDSLLAKHPATCWIGCLEHPHARAYLPAFTVHTSTPRAHLLGDLIQAGQITVDHRCHLESDGTLRDHGDQWRLAGGVHPTVLFEQYGTRHELLPPDGDLPTVILDHTGDPVTRLPGIAFQPTLF